MICWIYLIRSTTLASTETLPDSVAVQLVIFRLESHTYAIDLEAIREIIPFRRATRLPGAPKVVAGLVNVRGTVVTVFDLGERFEQKSSARAGGSVMLLEHRGKLVGVAVHTAVEVRHVDAQSLDEAAAEASEGAVRALTLLDGEVVLVLDIHAVLGDSLL